MLRLLCFLCLIIGYGFGLFQTAHIYSSLRNIDIKKEGSGNAGATNMFRVMGWKAGLITFLGDILKMVIAVIVTRWVVIGALGLPIDIVTLKLYTGLGVVLGHNFPFYLNFKGGKGVAASAALVCCIWDWKYILIGAMVFFGIVILTKYVSLGSICMMTAFGISFIVFTLTGGTYIADGWLVDSIAIACILSGLCIFQHRSNIKRLIAGKESKFSFKQEKSEAKANGEIVQQQIAENKIERKEYKSEVREVRAEGKAIRQNARKEYKSIKKNIRYNKKALKQKKPVKKIIIKKRNRENGQ